MSISLAAVPVAIGGWGQHADTPTASGAVAFSVAALGVALLCALAGKQSLKRAFRRRRRQFLLLLGAVAVF